MFCGFSSAFLKKKKKKIIAILGHFLGSDISKPKNTLRLYFPNFVHKFHLDIKSELGKTFSSTWRTGKMFHISKNDTILADKRKGR